MTDTTQATADALSRASALLEIGRDFEAEAILSKELSGNPHNAVAHALMSIAVRDSDASRSLQLAQRAAALQPSDSWFQVNLAWAARAMKRDAAAIAAAREAVRLDPYNADAYRALAQILASNRKMITEAKEAAAIACQLEPHEEATWIALGNVARAEDDLSTADACYHEALRINPESQPAKLNLARNREAEADIGDAMNLLQSIIRLDPRDERARQRIDELVVKLLDCFLWLAVLVGVIVSIVIVGIIDATN
jgi:tetratricopeptide (TPR) repeat protein